LLHHYSIIQRLARVARIAASLREHLHESEHIPARI
jgi:hypothetical protein